MTKTNHCPKCQSPDILFDHENNLYRCTKCYTEAAFQLVEIPIRVELKGVVNAVETNLHNYERFMISVLDDTRTYNVLEMKGITDFDGMDGHINLKRIRALTGKNIKVIIEEV